MKNSSQCEPQTSVSLTAPVSNSPTLEARTFPVQSCPVTVTQNLEHRAITPKNRSFPVNQKAKENFCYA
ncbi:hypothetical protein EYC84_010441 [Monilinia fructicola]|uniref:Uncharacterized protein n=1 Tax=Monilinia fructicola TaxID=38448 RepID=A0A5M9JGH8_MONFR|nr:hypothetical protein EYC84_010441 [Monilinia fructicola]